jgi:hypothetical protein
MENKVCCRCKVKKVKTDFHKSKSNKDGLSKQCKNCKKEYYENNREHILDYHKNHYQSNLENILQYSNEYRKNNLIKIRDYRRKYKIQRRHNNPLYHTICTMRCLIHAALKSNTNNTNTKTYKILGCTNIEFKSYIESQFQPWMNWNNRGLYNGEPNYGWDIDHIIPMSSAKIEEDVIKLTHYTNIRPRCSYLNRTLDNKKYKINT